MRMETPGRNSVVGAAQALSQARERVPGIVARLALPREIEIGAVSLLRRIEDGEPKMAVRMAQRRANTLAAVAVYRTTRQLDKKQRPSMWEVGQAAGVGTAAVGSGNEILKILMRRYGQQ